VLSPRGTLRGFDADGHAGADEAGRNIACAAATSLLRTAGRLCAERSLVTAGGALAPGEMRLHLDRSAEDADTEWLKGMTDFLLRGLNDLAQEFPREINVRTETTEV
jgi:uncharacterized protein YsxB (DUF464 family)